MDEKKESARLRKLAQMYALGEITHQEFRKQRDSIIDYCGGLISEIPEPEETPVNVIDHNIERLEGEATAMRASSALSDEPHTTKNRLWGTLIIVAALIASGFAIYSVYS